MEKTGSADHERLRRIAADKSKNEETRIAAVSKLGADDQDLLQIIAADRPEDPDLYDYVELRAAAVARLSDEALLRKYLRSGQWQIRLAAMTALKDQDVLRETVLDTYCSRVMRETALRYVTDQDLLFEIAMNDERYVDGPDLAAMAAKRVEDPERLAEIAMEAATFEASRIAAGKIHDDRLLRKVLREVQMDDTDERKSRRWRDPVGQLLSDGLLAQMIMCAAAENLSDLKPLVRIVLDDPGDGIYTTADNFKECGIRLLSEDPEAMLEYVREETDSLALDFARGWADDPRVIRAISDNPHSD